MRLAEWIARYPSLRLATTEDNARILAFFEQAPLRTSDFDLQYRRQPDFFRLLRFQSDRAFTILDVDGQGKVRGIGTLSLRPGWVDGRPTTIGYLGDLRIDSGKVRSRVWRALFSSLVIRAREIEEIEDCTHWYTALLDGNHAALAALRPREGQPELIPIGPFTMRNLVMRLPWAGLFRSSPRWKTRMAGPSDAQALTDFFEAENRDSHFGFRGEMARRLSNWEGLSIGDFVCASDAGGLAACMAPWSPDSAKQTLVSRIPTMLRLIGMGAKLFPKPPLRMPASGDRLRSPYLTHLTFAARLSPRERVEVFRAMLDFLFDRWRDADWHCVSFCDFQAWNLGSGLKGFVQQTVPITVYTIVPPNPGLDGSKLSHHSVSGNFSDEACLPKPPAFEMAMV